MANGVQFRTYRNVLIADWFGEDVAGGVEEMSRQVARLREHSGGPIGIINIIAEGSAMPDGNARGRLGKIYQGDHLFALLAVEGSGFRAAAVRAVASGISRLAQLKFPFEAHAGLRKTHQRATDLLKLETVESRQLLFALEGCRRRRAA